MDYIIIMNEERLRSNINNKTNEEKKITELVWTGSAHAAETTVEWSATLSVMSDSLPCHGL